MKLYPIIEDRLFSSARTQLLTSQEKVEIVGGYGVDVVVNLWHTADEDMKALCKEYIHFPIPDGKNVDVETVKSLVGRIEALLRDHRILVHCYGGRNRTGLVCALLLCRLYGLSGKAAYYRMRIARPNSLVNKHFRKFLFAQPAHSQQQLRKCIIWLTGGNCCGKTTILRALAERFAADRDVLILSADGDRRLNCPVAESVEFLEKLLQDKRLKVLMLEGTRLTVPLFKILSKLDPKRTKFDFRVYLIRSDAELVAERIEARRIKAGRQVATSSYLGHEQRLKYECTGERQLRAVHKYRKEYPCDLTLVETLPNFSEQLGLIKTLDGLIAQQSFNVLKDNGGSLRVGGARVINVRGTSGSGKSHLMRFLIDEFAGEPLRSSGGKIIGYSLSSGSVVVGSYENECGGCDGIKTQDEVCDRVREFARRYRIVLFEGVVVGTIFDRYFKLSQELGGMVWAYLDTPYEVCLERIMMRRYSRGDFDLISDFEEGKVGNTKAKFESLLKQREKAMQAGENVIVLNYQKAKEQILELIANVQSTVR